MRTDLGPPDLTAKALTNERAPPCLRAPTPPDVGECSVAHTVVSTETVVRPYELLRDDPRLDFAITIAPDRFNTGCHEVIDSLGIPLIDFDDATSQPWDLVLVGTHGGAHLFDRAEAVVFVPHGVGAGKTAIGVDFTYGSPFVLRDGEPIYTTMLEGSEVVRDRALDMTPELADTVAVVGELETDGFLELLARRDECRAALGVHPDETLLLISATWGEHGLLARYGGELLASAGDLPARYKVALRAHPHNWTSTGEPRPALAEALAKADPRVMVIGHEDTWMTAYAAADLAVFDFGSLALRFALGPRPMIATPVAEGVVTEGSSMATLRSLVPLLPEPSLSTAVALAEQVGVPAGLPTLRHEITSYPGEAAERTAEVLYEALRLPINLGAAA